MGSRLRNDYKNVNMTNEDYSDKDLINQDLSNKDLSGSDFTSTKLIGSKLLDITVDENTIFTETDFTEAEINSEFSGNDFTEANFKEAKINTSDFKNCEFLGAKFFSAEITNVIFNDCNFQGVDFSNANFSNNVQFIDVSEINFEDAIFMNTSISSKYKNIFGEDREGIDYIEPDYSPKDYSDQDLSGKKLINMDFSGANLRGKDFSESRLQDANFSGADLTDAIFKKANLDGAKFDEKTKLDGANFTEAKIPNVDLSMINKNDKVDMTNAYLSCTKLPEKSKIFTPNAQFIIDPKYENIKLKKDLKQLSNGGYCSLDYLKCPDDYICNYTNENKSKCVKKDDKKVTRERNRYRFNDIEIPVITGKNKSIKEKIIEKAKEYTDNGKTYPTIPVEILEEILEHIYNDNLSLENYIDELSNNENTSYLKSQLNDILKKYKNSNILEKYQICKNNQNYDIKLLSTQDDYIFSEFYEDLRNTNNYIFYKFIFMTPNWIGKEKFETCLRLFAVFGMLSYLHPHLADHNISSSNANNIEDMEKIDISNFFNDTVKDSGDKSDLTLYNESEIIFSTAKNKNIKNLGMAKLDLADLDYITDLYKERNPDNPDIDYKIAIAIPNKEEFINKISKAEKTSEKYVEIAKETIKNDLLFDKHDIMMMFKIFKKTLIKYSVNKLIRICNFKKNLNCRVTYPKIHELMFIDKTDVKFANSENVVHWGLFKFMNIISLIVEFIKVNPGSYNIIINDDKDKLITKIKSNIEIRDDTGHTVYINNELIIGKNNPNRFDFCINVFIKELKQEAKKVINIVHQHENKNNMIRWGLQEVEYMRDINKKELMAEYSSYEKFKNMKYLDKDNYHLVIDTDPEYLTIDVYKKFQRLYFYEYENIEDLTGKEIEENIASRDRIYSLLFDFKIKKESIIPMDEIKSMNDVRILNSINDLNTVFKEYSESDIDIHCFIESSIKDSIIKEYENLTGYKILVKRR